jgi:hypothetical protein
MNFFLFIKYTNKTIEYVRHGEDDLPRFDECVLFRFFTE